MKRCNSSQVNRINVDTNVGFVGEVLGFYGRRFSNFVNWSLGSWIMGWIVGLEGRGGTSD